MQHQEWDEKARQDVVTRVRMRYYRRFYRKGHLDDGELRARREARLETPILTTVEVSTIM